MRRSRSTFRCGLSQGSRYRILRKISSACPISDDKVRPVETGTWSIWTFNEHLRQTQVPVYVTHFSITVTAVVEFRATQRDGVGKTTLSNSRKPTIIPAGMSLYYLGTTVWYKSEAATTRRPVLLPLSHDHICFPSSPGPLEHDDSSNQIDGDCQRNLFRTRDGNLVAVKRGACLDTLHNTRS